MLRYNNANRVTATAGTVGAYIVVPVGQRLRLASARNITKTGQRVQLVLTDQSKVPGTGNAPTALSKESIVLANFAQDGVNDALCWTGNTGRLGDGCNVLVALFWNTDIGDELIMSAGIDDE